MATAPAYAATPVGAAVQIATANANRNGTGTLGTVLTGVSTGTRVDDIYIRATVTTTAGTVRFFVSFDGGTNKYLLLEVAVPANTVSATNPAWSYALTNLGWTLPNTSAILYASTEKAEAINILVMRAGSF